MKDENNEQNDIAKLCMKKDKSLDERWEYEIWSWNKLDSEWR